MRQPAEAAVVERMEQFGHLPLRRAVAVRMRCAASRTAKRRFASTALLEAHHGAPDGEQRCERPTEMGAQSSTKVRERVVRMLQLRQTPAGWADSTGCGHSLCVLSRAADGSGN